MTKIDINYTFGRLTVIEPAPTHVTPSGTKFRMWRCVCTCGNEKVCRLRGIMLANTDSDPERRRQDA